MRYTFPYTSDQSSAANIRPKLDKLFVLASIIAVCVGTTPAQAQSKADLDHMLDDVWQIFYNKNAVARRSAADTTYPKLTMALLDQVNEALSKLQKLWTAEPVLAHRPWIRVVMNGSAIPPINWLKSDQIHYYVGPDELFVWGDDPGYLYIPADTITELIAGYPQMTKAINEAGLTPARYVRALSAYLKAETMITLMDNATARGKSIPLDSSTVLPANIAFVQSAKDSPAAKRLAELLRTPPPPKPAKVAEPESMDGT